VSDATNPVQVVFDAGDPGVLAQFWAVALGYQLQPPPPGFPDWPAFLASVGVPESAWNDKSALVDPSGRGPRLFFQKVPEGKTAKNRVHVDVNAVAVSGGDIAAMSHEERCAAVDQHVRVVLAAGAEKVQTYDEMGEYWVVLRDPEGNEFCVQ
jgi:hypothetical protein